MVYLNTTVCTAAASNKTNGLGSCGPEGKNTEFTTDEANTLTSSKYPQAVQNRSPTQPKSNFWVVCCSATLNCLKASLDLKRQTSVAQTAFLIICSQTE